MTDAERKALERYLAAERELEKARWAPIAAINAALGPLRACSRPDGRRASARASEAHRGPFAHAKYSATLKTANPVSCSALKSSAGATGPAKYGWTPKAKSSTGPLGLSLTEGPSAAFSGEVTAGSYAPLSLAGTVMESYVGGPTCGEKAAPRVKKGTFSGSSVSFG